MPLLMLLALLTAQCALALFLPFVYAALMVIPIVHDLRNDVTVPTWIWVFVGVLFLVPGAAFLHALFAMGNVLYGTYLLHKRMNINLTRYLIDSPTEEEKTAILSEVL